MYYVKISESGKSGKSKSIKSKKSSIKRSKSKKMSMKSKSMSMIGDRRRKSIGSLDSSAINNRIHQNLELKL